jgi:phenylacetate-CoA ligase
MGVDVKKLPLRIGVFGAEPWSEEMRRYIQKESNIRAYDIYGLSEIIGPGVGIECQCQDGLHIFEDHFLVEIVDPRSGMVLPDGEEGELILTTLSKQAMPILRYRTRDITRIITERCGCGRSIRRVARVFRRSDDMFIIRGVNVFPSQIEAALLKVEKTLPHYQIIIRRERDMDVMEVRIEVTPEVFSDRVGEIEAMAKKLAHAVESTTGIRVKINLVEPQTLQRSEGKSKRVLDLRNIEEVRL